MTSKELLYKWVCDKLENGEKKFSFKQKNDEAGTFFEEMKTQPELEVYDIKNRLDMEKYMEKYFDDDLTDIGAVCIRAFLDGVLKINEEIARGGGVKAKRKFMNIFIIFSGCK